MSYETKFCIDHSKHSVILKNHDRMLQSLDNRIWGVLILLLINLGGIIGILIKTLFKA